jgi:hypothetical protein
MSSRDLLITLTEGGFAYPANGKDLISLKAETVSPITVQRNPIIIPLPGASIVGIELGRHNNIITVSGVANKELTEIDVYSPSTPVAGDIIAGDSALDTLTSPNRSDKFAENLNNKKS